MKHITEDHSKNPKDKYKVVFDKKNKCYCVYEGTKKVKEFDSQREAQTYATKQNKNQGLTEADTVDTITMDVPLFLRMLEFAKEDAKSDMDLHDVTEKAVARSKQGTLNMKDYNDLTNGQADAKAALPENIRKQLVKTVADNIKEDASSRSEENEYIGRGQLRKMKKDYDFRRLNTKTQDKVEDELEDGGEVTLENNHMFDDEGAMVKSQLISIVKDARDLYDMMDESTQLEGWVQSKITKAQDYLQAVSNYLYGLTAMSSDSFTINENKK